MRLKVFMLQQSSQFLNRLFTSTYTVQWGDRGVWAAHIRTFYSRFLPSSAAPTSWCFSFGQKRQNIARCCKEEKKSPLSFPGSRHLGNPTFQTPSSRPLQSSRPIYSQVSASSTDSLLRKRLQTTTVLDKELLVWSSSKLIYWNTVWQLDKMIPAVLLSATVRVTVYQTSNVWWRITSFPHDVFTLNERALRKQLLVVNFCRCLAALSNASSIWLREERKWSVTKAKYFFSIYPIIIQ